MSMKNMKKLVKGNSGAEEDEKRSIKGEDGAEESEKIQKIWAEVQRGDISRNRRSTEGREIMESC